MPCKVASRAGFCSGVQRAVQMALDAAARARAEGVNCFSLGEVVHNPCVTRRLEAMGVRVVQAVAQARGGVLLLRSHGVAPDVLAQCEREGVRYVDCTCPHVRALHELAAAYSASGRPVVILGDRAHPEVRGTAGWCAGERFIVGDAASAREMPLLDEALIVCQTTLPESQWALLAPLVRARVARPTEKRTLCAATRLRMLASLELAANADCMLVVGGKQSANTRKLYEACKAICGRTILVECAADIPPHFADIHTDHIGIAAGASTPDWSLKEVVNAMNDIENKDQTLENEQAIAEPQQAEEVKTEAAAVEETAPVSEGTKVPAEDDFMASVEASMRRIHTGQTVTGTVVQATDDEVCVNIGYKSDGLIKRADLVDEDVKIGDEIEVEVVKVNDGEGNVILSQRNIVNRKAWDALMLKADAGEYVEGVGKEAVKGGLICQVDGIRAFVPASRLSKRYVEKIDQFVGQTMKLKIIDVDKAKKRIVCSRKDVLIEEETARKASAWENIVEGAVVKGVVRRFADFGAFVDLGGVDGLIHVTDMAWHRVGHPSEVLQINQEVEVKILSVDRERERIQLGYKQLQPKPWDNIEEKYPVGLILERKVVRIRPFGAFIELEPGVDGLVHISQVALTRVNKVEDALEVGQIVAVKVLGVDPAAHRISLSIREVLEDNAFDYGDGIPEGEEALGDYPTEDTPVQE